MSCHLVLVVGNKNSYTGRRGEREREAREFNEFSFSLCTRIWDGLRERKKEREKCQSYDSEFTGRVEKEE